MGHPHTTRTVARTVVVAGWLLAVVVAGTPGWLAVVLAVVLVLVWASPFAVVTNRHPAPQPQPLPVAEPGSVGPAS